MREAEKKHARFIFEHARVIRLKELEKVAFLTVMVNAGKYPDYEECVLFSPAPFPLAEGDVVTVTGEIQKRKPRDGGKEWKVEFIAREFRKGDDALAPRPKYSGERRDTKPAEPETPDDDIAF